MTRIGADLSAYQGNVSPAELAGLDFVYVKITEGSDYKSPYAQQQASAAASAGVPCGPYHFVDVNVPMEDQFLNFQQMYGSLGKFALPAALDIETIDPSGWSVLGNLVVNLALKIEALTGKHVILYVNDTFYADLPGFPWGRGVWLADPSHAEPSHPCLLWQKGERPLAGQTAGVDSDQFEGSEAQWAAFTGSQPGTNAPSAPQKPVSAPQPPSDTQESQMPVSAAVTYRSGQYDVFQITAGKLYHYFRFAAGGGWNVEDLGDSSGQDALAPILVGSPAVAVVGGVCIVTAEDEGGGVWCYQQGATGGWEASKA